MVLLRAHVRRVPDAGADRRRDHLFSRPALASGRNAQRLPHHAPQGQDGRPLQRVLRDRVSRRLGAPRRRGRARGQDHHRHGPAHKARLRRRLGGRDARRAGAGPLARRTPHRVPEETDRPAGDDRRARRPRAGERGRNRPRLPPRPRLRPGGGGRAGGGVHAPRDAHRQILDLQAPAGPCLRGAGMPRRRRVRRGGTDAAPVSRLAAQRDLGGLGQRHRPRRPARPRPRAGQP